MGRVAFKISGDAYRIINEGAVDAVTSTLFLFQRAQEVIRNAADIGNDVWTVDCTQQESADIEDWFNTRARVESNQPRPGAALRILQLHNAAEAVRRGRRQSAREWRGLNY